MRRDHAPVSRVDKRSRHPEVNQENQAAFEPKNQIFAASVDRSHALARELCSHLCGVYRARQPGIEDLDFLEAASDQPGLEARPHGLDFGQLGHPASVAPELTPASSAPALADVNR